MIGEGASQFVFKFVAEFRAFWQDQIDKISFELATFEEFATAVLQTVAKRDGCHHVITVFKIAAEKTTVREPASKESYFNRRLVINSTEGKVQLVKSRFSL